MPRHRLGIALLVPEPARSDIDTLRRALGDEQLERLPTHLTLVPPVNVHRDDLSRALGVLRAAGAASRPLTLEIGPAETFLPATPVLYLSVAGDVDAVHALRDRVFVPPFERRLSWPFEPHVTLLDEGEPSRLEAAVVALADYRTTVTIERVHVLEDVDRVWSPIADAELAAPAVVGRGPLEVELTESETADPDTADFLRKQRAAHDDAMLGSGARWERAPVSLTARREGRIVGAATGWTGLGVGYLSELVVDVSSRREGIGSHLLAAFEAAAVRRGCPRLALRTDAGSDARSFYESRGWRVEATFAEWLGGHEFVQLRRDR